MFAGHTDVVPAGDEAAWTHPPFAAEIAHGQMYGRGAVDMKGGIACFAAAVARHIEKRGALKGSVSFLITGDEEGPSINGTAKLLDWAAAKGEVWDAAIVGEPTNPEQLGDMIKVGRRGSLSGVITVNGRQGHSAYPHLADNPLRGLMQLADALLRPPFDAGTKNFQPTNLELTSIDVGNPAGNVTPAKATLAFNIRFNDTWTAETLQAEIHNRLDRAARRKTYRKGRKELVDYEVEWRGRAEPRLPDPRRQPHRHARPIDRGRHGPYAAALDVRRDLGRALHQGLLPGRRVRPGRQDHAHGRRTRCARRPGNADGHLWPLPRRMVRLSMPRLEEIQQYFTGSWRMMMGKPEGLRLLDISADGFWNSFFAIAIALPALIAGWVTITNTLASGYVSFGDRLSIMLRLATVDLGAWIIPIAAFAAVAGPSGLSDRFAHYVISSNWGSALLVWLMLPPTLLRMFVPSADDFSSIISLALFVALAGADVAADQCRARQGSGDRDRGLRRHVPAVADRALRAAVHRRTARRSDQALG